MQGHKVLSFLLANYPESKGAENEHIMLEAKESVMYFSITSCSDFDSLYNLLLESVAPRRKIPNRSIAHLYSQ